MRLPINPLAVNRAVRGVAAGGALFHFRVGKLASARVAFDLLGFLLPPLFALQLLFVAGRQMLRVVPLPTVSAAVEFAVTLATLDAESANVSSVVVDLPVDLAAGWVAAKSAEAI